MEKRDKIMETITCRSAARRLMMEDIKTNSGLSLSAGVGCYGSFVHPFVSISEFDEWCTECGTIRTCYMDLSYSYRIPKCHEGKVIEPCWCGEAHTKKQHPTETADEP